ncbi:MAG: sigma-54-dependent Fis family transcriptional regulator [Nitrospira sp.]|nr:sigma-54-dependent Fis family transcriptional regulator [Nitrospira sp.]HBP88908.1 Fis family transcriptional regulator [Nitrospiraceae bacterium]HNP30372.1 sigma-54 dependent transcriptional regulator [Nitrospirales bacterium]
MRATIYVTDDDQNVCSALSRRLVKKGHLVRSFHSGASLIEALEHELPDLLFLDLKMPEMDGIDTLRQIRQTIPKTLIIMLTAYGSVEDAVEAMRLGAYDFLIKSIDFSTVEPALHRALTFLELRRRIEFSASEKQRKYSWDHVIARSPAMTKVVEQLKFFDAEDAPLVFLHGEVGTGKEFLARILHYNSHKHLGPFVAISCNEHRGSLIEPQIFGYERGAFSGANQATPGAIEHSDGGTLFIDEIEHLPIPVQGGLAEAIRTRSFCRMGGFDRLPLHNRIIMTSATPLEHKGHEEIFHPELRSLLEKQQISIPPLRDRKEDIIPLVIKTIHAYGEEIGRPKLDIDSSVPPLLNSYQFPGNIRELEAMIRRAVLCSQGPVLTSLDFYSQHTDGGGEGISPNTGRVLFEIGLHSLQDIQAMVIDEVLRFTKQDKDQAARYLHLSKQALDEHLTLRKKFPNSAESS